MNGLIVQRSRRISYVCGAAILFLAAVPGKAANLVDVRIVRRELPELGELLACPVEAPDVDQALRQMHTGHGRVGEARDCLGKDLGHPLELPLLVKELREQQKGAQ